MFMTPAELAGLHSMDYRGHTAAEIRPEMEAKHAASGEPDYRGAPTVSHYLDRMREHYKAIGGVDSYVHVWHDQDNNQHLLDGHHRSLIARENNMLVPVSHHEGTLPEATDSAFLGPTSDPDIPQWLKDQMYVPRRKTLRESE